MKGYTTEFECNETTEYGYMGFVESENRYRLFATEQEYMEEITEN